MTHSWLERDNLGSLWTLSLWKREPLTPVDSQSLEEGTSDPCGLSVSERGNLWSLWTLSLWKRESLIPVDSQSLKEGISDPCGLSVSERGNPWPLWTLSLSRERTLSWLSVCHHASPPTGQRKEKQLGKPTFAIPTELESLPLPSQQNWKAYLCHPNRTGVKLWQTMVGFVPSLPDAVVRGTVGSFDVKHQVLNKGHLIQCLDDAQTCT